MIAIFLSTIVIVLGVFIFPLMLEDMNYDYQGEAWVTLERYEELDIEGQVETLEVKDNLLLTKYSFTSSKPEALNIEGIPDISNPKLILVFRIITGIIGVVMLILSAMVLGVLEEKEVTNVKE